MKLVNYIFVFVIFIYSSSFSESPSSFLTWKENFKKTALKNDISEKTFDIAMANVKFLPNVIKYDRYQPEFYEDTKTYIGKRTSSKKVSKGVNFYKKNFNLINTIEDQYKIEKELLLALMGIETNFGTYVGKMDILSSLATLSYDQRRSEFFTNELLILLKLIENNQIDYKTLYGSWAGAFGYFQFMPSTMKNYAIDFDKNSYIDLKNNKDAYASAANYLSKIGWNDDQPCFYKIDLSPTIPKKYLNVSAKKLHNKKKLKYFRKYIINSDILDKKFDNLEVSLITPDKDIIPDAENLSPAYVVFDNYEIILKWNRSLRFSLAVCTLKDKFNDEL
ncbi:lytic murein transglycosylase [Candidatus Pelagibacter bacterium nBUS_25]|uniref:lytic murein transglycosylase n=1 Tax=Candidatus Pelagibacter bacterium nBUS_25 TaxID=3374187 RepID=UPI003EBA34E8